MRTEVEGRNISENISNISLCCQKENISGAFFKMFSFNIKAHVVEKLENFRVVFKNNNNQMIRFI